MIENSSYRPVSKLSFLLLALAVLNIATIGGFDALPSVPCVYNVIVGITSRPRVALKPSFVSFLEGEPGIAEAEFPGLANWTISPDRSSDLEWSITGESENTKTVVVSVRRPPGFDLELVHGGASVCARSTEGRGKACGDVRAAGRIRLVPSIFKKTLTSEASLLTTVQLVNPEQEPWAIDIVEKPSFLMVQVVSWNFSIAEVSIETINEELPKCQDPEPPCLLKGKVKYRVRMGDESVERTGEYIVWYN